MSKGRSGRPWLRLRAELLAYATTCHRCGTWISDALPPGHPHKATAGHVIELDARPDLAEDPANLRPECWRCNTAAGARYGNRKRGRRRRVERGVWDADWLGG